MKLQKRVAKQRSRRRFHVRNKVRAAKTDRIRLSVFRSNKHIYAQLIDDVQGVTVVAASTTEPAVAGDKGVGGNKAAAAKVGKALAERAAEKGIKQAAFDRGQYRYHGRVAALADAAREAGLEI